MPILQVYPNHLILFKILQIKFINININIILCIYINYIKLKILFQNYP